MLVDHVLAALGERALAVAVIDGRSGSGKTSLAGELAAHLGAQVLHLDDLYPGWDGLAAGSDAVAAVLADASYRRFDWAAGAFGDTVRLDRSRPLIVEGCGALTRRTLDAAELWAAALKRVPGGEADAPGDGMAAVVGVWLECPEPLRRDRALARDGAAFATQWDAWAAQESRHIGLHRPAALADLIARCGGAAPAQTLRSAR